MSTPSKIKKRLRPAKASGASAAAPATTNTSREERRKSIQAELADLDGSDSGDATDEDDDDKDGGHDVLQCYGLDVLEPDKWVPTVTVLDEMGMGTHTGTALGLPMSTADESTGALDDLLGLGKTGSVSLSAAALRPMQRMRASTESNSDTRSVHDGKRGDGDRDVGNSIDPTNTEFNPHAYLVAHYSNASFLEIKKGMQHLQTRLEQRTEFLRTLVQNNLDRFMNSKEAIDAFCTELRTQELIGDAAGSQALRKTLKAAADQSQSMFNAMLQRRSQADNLRKRLTFYEQHRFIFNLPATLRVTIGKKNYDQAVRDYKKGRQYADSDMPAYRKAWNEVLMIIRGLKIELASTLREQAVSVDVQERLIEHLVDLQTNAKGELEGSTDPAWEFLSYRFEGICKHMQALADTYARRLSEVDRVPLRHDQNELRRRRIISVVLHNRVGVFFGDANELQDQAWKKWLQCRRHVEQLSTVFTNSLPDLSRLVRSYVEGQFSKRLGYTNRQLGQQNAGRARHIIRDIVQAYTNHVISAMHMATGTGEHVKISAVDPLQAAFILTRINYDVVQCWDIVRSIKISYGDDNSSFTKIRSVIIGIVCDAWLGETKRFAEYEHWVADGESSQTTIMPRLFRELSRLVLLSLRDIAAYQTAVAPTTTATIKGTPSPVRTVTVRVVASLRERIRTAAFGVLSSFTDVLRYLATASSETIDLPLVIARTRRLRQMLIANVDDPAIRLLVVLSNAVYIKTVMVPSLQTEFEAFFETSASHAASAALAHLTQLETLLYQRYLSQQMGDITALVERGMLWSGVNWLNTTRPTEVRSYVFEILMRIVKVHCQVTDTCRTTLQRIIVDVLVLMGTFFADMTTQIGQFGIGGMMQAMLEIEFIQLTMAHYETPASKASFALTMALLRNQTRLVPPPQSQSSSSSNTTADKAPRELGPSEAKDPLSIQAEFKEVRELLRQTRRASEEQFRCFSPISTITQSSAQ